MANRAFLAPLVLILLFVLTLSAPAASSVVTPQPTGLVVTIIPPKLPSDGGTYPAVVVSLVDSSGYPTEAQTSMTVELTSSQTGVASVPSSLTIPGGSEYGVANLTATTTAGSSMIGASSHGLNSGSASVTTVLPTGYPAQLLVYVSPSSLLPRADLGVFRVELVDAAGLPSKAISPVNVLLLSSNESVANVEMTSITISQGDIYATGSFSTTGTPGTTQFSAASPGLKTGFATVTVVSSIACGSSCEPAELTLRLIPATLPADSSNYQALEVGLATSTGLPAVSSTNTPVTLSSSSLGIVSMPYTSIYIPAGSISVLVGLTTTFVAGKANITALPGLSGLQLAYVTLTTTTPSPSALQAYIAPPSLFVTPGDNHPIMVVQLQDASGNPAVAREATGVTITSSNSSMISGPIDLSIATGDDYALAYLPASGSGQTVLTVSSSGFNSSQVTLNLARTPSVVSTSTTSSSATPVTYVTSTVLQTTTSTSTKLTTETSTAMTLLSSTFSTTVSTAIQTSTVTVTAETYDSVGYFLAGAFAVIALVLGVLYARRKPS